MDLIEDCSDKKSVNEADKTDHGESGKKPLKYPKQVFFIISNEFCERFCFYGNRTILAIYLQSMLHYSEDNATIIYHTFVMLCYFFPLIGAIIADCYLGKFRTILYLSMLYAVGNVILSIASDMSLPLNHTTFSLLGLFLIAVGTGGIKPCVSSFGGDQFVMPEQERQLASFFSVFYFSINAGSLISTYLTPELRVLSCFGRDFCYPLAFGIPAALMITSLVVFVCGKPLYTMKNPQGNILVDVAKCVGSGIWGKCFSKDKKAHWLDHAEIKYKPELIKDTKILLELIYLFSPTILFWALYDMQGSRWTFQALHMDGRIWGYEIKPDQMQAVNPVLILLFIPLFDLVVYPALATLGLVRTSLQKLFWGGIIAAIAFGMSAYVEYKVKDAYAVLPQSGESQLRVFNEYNCSVSLNVSGQAGYSWLVPADGLLECGDLLVQGNSTLTYSAAFIGQNCPSLAPITGGEITLYEQQAVSFIIAEQTMADKPSIKIERLNKDFDDLTKSDNAEPKIRIVYNINMNVSYRLSSKNAGSSQSGILASDTHVTETFTITSDSDYALVVDDKTVATDLDLGMGGVYSLLLIKTTDPLGSCSCELFTLTPPNNVHILWQLPQIMVISIAEIMFSITGLEFSYSRAPASMKSVISSIWLLTDSLGNLLIVVVSELTKNIPQDEMLAIFGVMMVGVMGVFVLLARRYTRVMKIICNQGSNGKSLAELTR